MIYTVHVIHYDSGLLEEVKVVIIKLFNQKDCLLVQFWPSLCYTRLHPWREKD